MKEKSTSGHYLDSSDSDIFMEWVSFNLHNTLVLKLPLIKFRARR